MAVVSDVLQCCLLGKVGRNKFVAVNVVALSKLEITESENPAIFLLAAHNFRLKGLAEAIKAADILARDGIEVDVINARFASPIDDKIISLLKEKTLVTIEDHRIACGFGSAVMEKAAQAGAVCSSIRVLGFGREFIRHDCRDAQLNQGGLNTDKIVAAVRDLAEEF